MRLSRLTGFLLLASAFSVIAFAASKPDFTGAWELDVKDSDFGNLPKPARMTIRSTMQGDAMHSVQTTYVEQENQTAEFTWYLDGKRHPSDKPVPGYSVTRWEDTTLVSERQSDDGAYKETIRMSLSKDGKTATETVETKNPSGTNKEKLIWHRKAQ
jgi:hypothetical protein